MSPKISVQIIWGYTVEILATTILYGFTVYLVGVGPLADFVQKTADEWNDLTGILFSAAIAIWLAFINARGSLFGEYLARQGGDVTYSRAFITAMIVFFLATVSLISCKGFNHFSVSHLAFILLLYSCINLVTMTRNATDLVRLYSTFNRELELLKFDAARRDQVQSSGNDSSEKS